MMVLAQLALAEGIFSQARIESVLFLSKALETAAHVTGAPSPLRKSSCCPAHGNTEQLLGAIHDNLLGTFRWTGCSCPKLFWTWSTPTILAPERMKDSTAERAFKDNRLHRPESHWETKTSHLGTLGRAIWEPWEECFPLDSPQGQAAWRKGGMASRFASAWTSRAGFKKCEGNLRILSSNLHA